MDVISRDDDPVVIPAPNLLTKASNHPLAQILLGQVVAAQHFADSLLLYFTDGHIARIYADDDGNVIVTDHKVPMC